MATLTQVVIATSNQHKFSEIVPVFAGTPWQPVLAHTVGAVVPEVEETGETFTENALLKAQVFSRATQLPVIADDTGLEVSALNGAPGVHSNRWYPGSYEDRNSALLEKLDGITDRSAQFTTVACLLIPGQEPMYFTGIVRGSINHTPVGTTGFGYDPVFIPEGFEKSFAELGAAVKQELSHRAQAFKQVVATLSNLNYAA